MPTKVICGARWKALLPTAGLVPFLLIAIRLTDPAETGWQAWLLVAVFWALIVVGGASTLFPAKLVLASDGFEVRHIFGKPVYERWDTIETLAVHHSGKWLLPTRSVVWRLRPGFSKSRSKTEEFFHRINRRRLGFDASLPAGWSASPQRILQIMQTYHSAALSGNAGNGPR